MVVRTGFEHIWLREVVSKGNVEEYLGRVMCDLLQGVDMEDLSEIFAMKGCYGKVS